MMSMKCPICFWILHPCPDYNTRGAKFYKHWVCGKHHYWHEKTLEKAMINVGDKMAYKEIQSAVHNFDNEPIIEGVFKGTKEMKHGVGYKIEKEDGTVVLVGSTSMLRDKMENVNEGDKIKIEFTGMEKTANGKYEYRVFKVYKDE